jgi:hypothetical protein
MVSKIYELYLTHKLCLTAKTRLTHDELTRLHLQSSETFVLRSCGFIPFEKLLQSY